MNRYDYLAKLTSFLKDWGKAIAEAPSFHAASAGTAVVLAFLIRFFTK